MAAIGAISNFPTHFSVQDPPKPWGETAQRVAVFILKIVLFPWALCELAKYALQRLIMLPLYPMQSQTVKKCFDRDKNFATRTLNQRRAETSSDLKEQGFEVQDVVLEKNGVRYSGILVGHRDQINNGQWVIQATGNCEPIECSFGAYAELYGSIGFNILLINGPAVGRSKGQARPDTMGEAQEMGISYLEHVVHAKKIVMAGRSLGGAAMGQAVLQHQFRKNIQYLSVQQMTFDRVSSICAKIVGERFPKLEWLVQKLVQWSCEMDSVEASRKLQERGITEVVIQATSQDISEEEIPPVGAFSSDGEIPAEASLGAALIREGVVGNKIFVGLKNGDHNSRSVIIATTNAVSRFFEEKRPAAVA